MKKAKVLDYTGGISFSEIYGISMTKDKDFDGYFGFMMPDDFMCPRIEINDFIIARAQSEVKNGEIAVLTTKEEKIFCGRLTKKSNGMILIPYSVDRDALFFSHEEMSELSLRVIGKVVEARHFYK